EELPTGRVGLGSATGHVRAAGIGPDVDSQLRVPGAQAPAIGDSIIGGQLRSVGLAVLAVADDEGVGCGRVELLHAAEPVVMAVVRRRRYGMGSLLVPVSQLVGQLLFGMEARAASQDRGR